MDQSWPTFCQLEYWSARRSFGPRQSERNQKKGRIRCFFTLSCLKMTSKSEKIQIKSIVLASVGVCQQLWQRTYLYTWIRLTRCNIPEDTCRSSCRQCWSIHPHHRVLGCWNTHPNLHRRGAASQYLKTGSSLMLTSTRTAHIHIIFTATCGSSKFTDKSRSKRLWTTSPLRTF